jgi:hypothetical protein
MSQCVLICYDKELGATFKVIPLMLYRLTYCQTISLSHKRNWRAELIVTRKKLAYLHRVFEVSIKLSALCMRQYVETLILFIGHLFQWDDIIVGLHA